MNAGPEQKARQRARRLSDMAVRRQRTVGIAVRHYPNPNTSQSSDGGLPDPRIASIPVPGRVHPGTPFHLSATDGRAIEINITIEGPLLCAMCGRGRDPVNGG